MSRILLSGRLSHSQTQHVICFTGYLENKKDHRAVKTQFKKFPVDDIAMVYNRSLNIGPEPPDDAMDVKSDGDDEEDGEEIDAADYF